MGASPLRGEKIQDFGGIKLRGRGENERARAITGRLTSVRKILASASQVAKKGKQLLWLSGDGGYIIPESSVVGRALQKELRRLIVKHGDVQLLPVYQEKGVYNFYMRVDEVLPVSAVDPAEPASSASASAARALIRCCWSHSSWAAWSCACFARAWRTDSLAARPAACSGY